MSGNVFKLTPQQEEHNRQVLEAKAREERRGRPALAAQRAYREWREQWRLDHPLPYWPAHRHPVPQTESGSESLPLSGLP